MEQHWIGVVFMTWIVCHKVYAIPDFGSSMTTVPLAEDASTGDEIVDLATTSPATFEWKSETPSKDPPRFAVHRTTGVVTLLTGAGLDYETTTYYDLVITATDFDTKRRRKRMVDTTDHTVRITITDVNDNTPVLPTYHWTVMDGATAGTSIGTVTATDADGTAANNMISSYAISDGNTGTTFTISATGELTVNTDKTVEMTTTMTGYSLTITATDSAAFPNAETGTGMAHIVIYKCSSATSVAAGAFVLLSSVLMTLV